MNYKKLITISETQFDNLPSQISNIASITLFTSGAKWMHKKLNDQESNTDKFDDSINFEFYGLLKYAISLSAFIVSFLFLLKINIALLPLSIPIFYLFEIHFLFLFPLLLDRVKNPLWASIKQTYRAVFFKTLFVVMQIGFFMVSGLFDLKDPFRKWHIGCLAVIIWYQNEVRNRI
jgi:hypothetical protein